MGQTERTGPPGMAVVVEFFQRRMCAAAIGFLDGAFLPERHAPDHGPGDEHRRRVAVPDEAPVGPRGKPIVQMMLIELVSGDRSNVPAERERAEQLVSGTGLSADGRRTEKWRSPGVESGTRVVDVAAQPDPAGVGSRRGRDSDRHEGHALKGAGPVVDVREGRRAGQYACGPAGAR